MNLYSVVIQPCERVDFEHSNYFLSTSSDSNFVQNRICAIGTEQGETTLFNDRLRIRRGDHVQESTIEAGPAYQEILREHFGIVLPPEVKLRPLAPNEER